MKYVAATVALWALAILGTVLIVQDQQVFTYLGPLYAICMIGAIMIVRQAQGSSVKPAA